MLGFNSFGSTGTADKSLGMLAASEIAARGACRLRVTVSPRFYAAEP